jgi:DNA invertase Pin-like site-specific DNA recombinase
MTGVIYCRVSSKEQIEGTSLESQQTACREYAQSKGIQVLKAFVEQGESAKFADRTQLLELIDFCRKSKRTVNVLLVWKIDRFARNVADHFSVKATLAKYGVRIVSVTEPIDTNPEGRLMETILAGFAQFDNDIRAMRTVQGMRRKLQEGIFPWGPPLGYKSSVTSNEKKTLPDLTDGTTFSLLRKAWHEFATGAYTQAEMGRLMQSWGLASVRGKSFAPQSLYQLFTNPYYAGVLVDPWTGAEYEGKHVPMVTRAEFARVQQVIAGRNRSVPHQKERAEFPLRGLVRCSGCHHALTAAFSRGRSRQYPYYLCQRHECRRRGKSRAAGEVHAEFESFLGEITPKPQLIQGIGERAIKAAAKSETEVTAQRQRRRKRIADLEGEIQELIRMRAQNLITDQEFLPQKKRLLDQRVALDSPSRRTIDANQVRVDVKEIVAPLSSLQNTWRSLHSPFRRRFERLILPGGFVIGNIRTADLGLLFSIFGASAPMKSGVVPFACTGLNPLISEISEFSRILCGTTRMDSELDSSVQPSA